MELYGRRWTRRELEARVGRIEQIGGIRRLQWTEGPEAAVEQIQVRTGGGLSYYVSPHRGLDISLTEFAGAPLSWQSANGDAHPSYYDSADAGWLRTAAGGLLMTCGLTQVGSPCEDEGNSYGLHGRAHHLPARQVAAEGRWIGDEYEMTVRGVVEETSIFGEHLRLTREIKSRLGDNRMVIRDVVENAGFVKSPHMMLYHFNFGFPLLQEDTDIIFPPGVVVPREQETPINGYDRWEAPKADYAERVYYHRLTAPERENNANAEEDKAEVIIRCPQFPLFNSSKAVPVEVHLRWSTKHLPKLVQWKMPGAGAHVLGIEPANCGVQGRAHEREQGTLVQLEPGEAVTYNLELYVC
jgi:hypothetical protein